MLNLGEGQSMEIEDKATAILISLLEMVNCGSIGIPPYELNGYGLQRALLQFTFFYGVL